MAQLRFLTSFKVYRFFLCFVFFLNTSCIHTASSETKSVEIEKTITDSVDILKVDNLQIRSKVYSDEKYPLSDFFNKLLRGDFKESFKKANLNYKPSNTKNEMLRNLLSSGLVPVYVSIKNTSSQNRTISYEQFSLSDDRETYQSLNPVNLPKQIRQFSPAAAASNVYNVTVVATVTLMLLVLIAYAPNGIQGGGGSGNFFDEPILNETQKTTRIDYKNYVIGKKTLAPNEELSGLLFFNLESMQDTSDFKIKFGETLN
jgi:hypothetical protein